MADKHSIDCAKSMHVLKNAFTKTYLAEQCEELLAGLDRAIAATVECAPVRRNNGYLVDRDGGAPSAKSTEALSRRPAQARRAPARRAGVELRATPGGRR